MRVNVYREEVTDEAEIIWAEPQSGTHYCGLRIYLKSAPELHQRVDDDDRSAVTFWFKDPDEARASLAAWGRVVEAYNKPR